MSRFRRLAHAAIPILHRAGQFPACSRKLNTFRRFALPRLDRVARQRFGRALIRDKTNADREHVATIDADLCDVEQALVGAGFSRAVVSTLKYVTVGGDRVYESAAWAYHSGSAQTHVYILEIGTDLHVYAHREPSYLADPAAHEGGTNQRPGDPENQVGPVLDAL